MSIHNHPLKAKEFVKNDERMHGTTKPYGL